MIKKVVSGSIPYTKRIVNKMIGEGWLVDKIHFHPDSTATYVLIMDLRK